MLTVEYLWSLGQERRLKILKKAGSGELVKFLVQARPELVDLVVIGCISCQSVKKHQSEARKRWMEQQNQNKPAHTNRISQHVRGHRAPATESPAAVAAAAPGAPVHPRQPRLPRTFGAATKKSVRSLRARLGVPLRPRDVPLRGVLRVAMDAGQPHHRGAQIRGKILQERAAHKVLLSDFFYSSVYCSMPITVLVFC